MYISLLLQPVPECVTVTLTWFPAEPVIKWYFQSVSLRQPLVLEPQAMEPSGEPHIEELIGQPGIEVVVDVVVVVVPEQCVLKVHVQFSLVESPSAETTISEGANPLHSTVQSFTVL